MRTLAELSTDQLRVAGDAIEAVIDHRAYLPADGMLVMLAGRFRDDIREALEVKHLGRADRGTERKPLEELGYEELTRLAAAVSSLVGRFRPFMDDPELVRLLDDLHSRLALFSFERANTAREARAS